MAPGTRSTIAFKMSPNALTALRALVLGQSVVVQLGAMARHRLVDVMIERALLHVLAEEAAAQLRLDLFQRRMFGRRVADEVERVGAKGGLGHAGVAALVQLLEGRVRKGLLRPAFL